MCGFCFALWWTSATLAQPATPFEEERSAGAVAPMPPRGDTPDGSETSEASDSDDILEMDIEQLSRLDVVVPAMDVEVTSVTRTESTVGRSAAAVFVIDQEMIRRSGARCIPEALQMAPGLEVARIDSSRWAVSARGFNSRFANKLLVQIDGRSVYTPNFSGVFWEALDVMLEDIERIEVIRGPGATVWGSNAVNGVINIITKKAKDTQGLLLSGGAGNEERGFTGLRYGGRRSNDLQWRVYTKQYDRDRGTVPGATAADDHRLVQSGFRADWTPNCCDTITVQGDYFVGDQGMRYPEQLGVAPYSRVVDEDVRLSGGNVLMRWDRDQGDGRSWALQCYYNRFSRELSVLEESLDTIDVDFQQQIPVAARHKLIYGGGYRYHTDHLPGGFSVRFDPDRRDTNLFSYFVQDEITLSEERLFLTVGSKFEHSSYTPFEYQPSARLLFSPDPRRAVWGAVSRAVRSPARADDDMRNRIRNIPLGPPPAPPMYVQLTGDRSIESEDMLAFEAGYRAQPTDRFSWDVALFFNRYEDLVVFVPNAVFPTPPPPLIWTWDAMNAMRGDTYGGELTATLAINPCWRVTGSYSFLRMALQTDPGIDPALEAPEEASPRNRVYLRSSWDLVHNLEFDLTLRYVDSIVVQRNPFASYITMDVRLGWRPSDHFEMAVVGQNLLDGHHYEFFGQDALATQVDRGAYGMVTWRY